MANSPPSNWSDVRMRGFARRSTVAEALAWLDAQVRPLAGEAIAARCAAGRVLAENVASRVDLPPFDRAMMDGYAVRAQSVAGATPYHALPLRIVGEAYPGRAAAGEVQLGEGVRIMTGAPLPSGADAVLPAESTTADGPTVLAHDEVTPGKHVGRRGEDVAAGNRVFSAGRLLRPQDIALLAAIGTAQVPVVRRPRVRVVVTGNELLPAGQAPRGFQIVDANGPMLAALVERDGGEPTSAGITPDDRAKLTDELRQSADLTIVAGGSSVGLEDHVPTLVAELGQLAIHGVAMRPSSPTGMGLVDGRVVLLLPGNPASCLCAYDFFAGRAVRVLGGRSADWPYRSTQAVLARKISSIIGRTDYARVKCCGAADGGIPLVEPLAIGGAALLTTVTAADGFVVVPPDSEGFAEGTAVTVFWYQA